MKKALFLVLSLAVVSGAFAQTPGLTFGTWTEVQAVLNSSVFFNVDSTDSVSFNARDTGLDANINASFGWREHVPSGPDLSIQDFSIWYRPFPFLKLKAGKLLESGDAMLRSYVGYNRFSTFMANGELGVMATAYPIRDLSVSAFSQFTGTFAAEALYNVSFSVKLALPKIATFVASYRVQNYDGHNVGKPVAYPFDLAVGVDLRMFSDLIMKFGIQQVWSRQFFGAMFTAGKKFGDLNLGIDANVAINYSSGTTFGFGLDGLAEYKIGKYIVGTRDIYAWKDIWHADWMRYSTGSAESLDGLSASIFVRREFNASSLQVALAWDRVNAWNMPIKFILFF